MDYVGQIFRPPSEAHSLLLQVTVGCSHNRCTYCDMYRDKQFRPKDATVVERDILEAKRIGPRFDRVFLCDGDALILSQKRLVAILESIRTHLPWVKRVGVYGDTRSVGRKSVSDLRTLKDLGLGIVYHGMESGSAKVLKDIDKGGTPQECVQTAEKLREAGLSHSVMVLLGIGGVADSARHAAETAHTLTQMSPPFVGALVTTVLPGTPLFERQARGEFKLPGKFALLEELRTIVREARFTSTRFSANHASNYLPIRAILPAQRDELLALLDEVIRTQDERVLKPESLRAL